ncbi:MAG TPA: hypothetical protein VHE14_01185 [Solirubrobacteraceae bacterium]|nr:hypothetical protein [Solirubrobacteraceae bacterium]
MYQFSRAIYRQLAQEIQSDRPDSVANHAQVLRACEAAIERLANDRHYFARPTRTLFNDVRIYFPMTSQRRVYEVIEAYMRFADDFLARQPHRGFDLNGNPLECRATTRKGTPCQRMPLPHNGYCPSHQHLADTEQIEVIAA